jgi:hypothetical protein
MSVVMTVLRAQRFFSSLIIVFFHLLPYSLIFQRRAGEIKMSV